MSPPRPLEWTPPQTLGLKHLVTKGKGEEVLIWTDGSKTGKKAGYGVYFGKDSHLNIAERTVGDQTSDNAELQATLRALEIATDMPDIHIITNDQWSGESERR